MDLILVRHGEIDSNLRRVYSGRSDEPLNARGLIQAQEAAAGLAGAGIQALVSSPLRRALQTAQRISQVTRVQVNTCDAFTELGMGPWEGLSEDEVAQRYPEAWNLWRQHPADLILPGRERLADVASRVMTGLRWVKSALGERSPIVVVSHVAILRVILLLARGQDLNLYRSLSIPNATPQRILFP